MSFELNYVLRSLRSRRRGLARFTAYVAVAGIAAGVASLIFAQAIGHGFQSEMQNKILANTPHIAVFPADEGARLNAESVVQMIRSVEDVKDVRVSASESAVLIGSKSTAFAVVRSAESGSSSNEVSISVGNELAKRTGAFPGDTVELVVFNGSEPRTQTVRVAGTFKTGLFDYDSSWIRISQDDFAKLTDNAIFAPTMLSVSVDDIYKADKTAARLREILGSEYRVLDWQEANRPLFAALSLERRAALIILSLIVIIAVLNITATLTLLVNERRLDIAVLRTVGARAGSLVSMFVLEGILLGLAGILSGVILGLAACIATNYFRLISLNEEVYSLSYIPLKPAFADVGLIAVAVFLLCLLATAYPAYRASRIKPMENLRNQ